MIQPQHGRFAGQFFVSTFEQLQGFFQHASCGWDPFGSAAGGHAQPNQHQGHPHARPRAFPRASIHRKRRVACRCVHHVLARLPSSHNRVSNHDSVQDDPRTETCWGDPDPALPTLRQSRQWKPRPRRGPGGIPTGLGQAGGGDAGWYLGPRRRCLVRLLLKRLHARFVVDDHGDTTRRGMEPREGTVAA